MPSIIKAMKEGVKELRSIIHAIPHLTHKQIELLKSLKIIEHYQRFSHINNKKTLTSEEEKDTKTLLNEDLKFQILSVIKEKNITAEVSYKLLIDTLSLLITQALSKHHITDKPISYLEPELYDYLLKSDLQNPSKQLHKFLATTWANPDNGIISNDNATLFLTYGNKELTKIWINAGFQPFTPTSNGESLIDYLKNNHKYEEIENIIILLIKNIIINFNKMHPVDLYQNIIFINDQLLYLERAKYRCSSKMASQVKLIFSQKIKDKIESLANQNTNIVNRWLFNKILDVLSTRQVNSPNRMLDLALFINPEHNYLAFDAITHGANPLSQVIKIHDNQCVSFFEILIKYNRIGELARALKHYDQVYKSLCQANNVSFIHQRNAFALNLASFLIENYEYTSNNAEEILMTLFEYLAKHDKESANFFANIEINFLYPAIIQTVKNKLYNQKYTEKENDYKFAKFLITILEQQPQNIFKDQAIKLLKKLEEATQNNSNNLSILTQYTNTITHQSEEVKTTEEPRSIHGNKKFTICSV